MGSRKHNSAEANKEARKNVSFAKLNNCPTSPTKMRLVADVIRGRDVEQALSILKHMPKESATRLHKLLLSAIANWQVKNEGQRMEDSHLFISEISVDGGTTWLPVVYFLDGAAPADIVLNGDGTVNRPGSISSSIGSKKESKTLVAVGPMGEFVAINVWGCSL